MANLSVQLCEPLPRDSRLHLPLQHRCHTGKLHCSQPRVQGKSNASLGGRRMPEQPEKVIEAHIIENGKGSPHEGLENQPECGFCIHSSWFL